MTLNHPTYISVQILQSMHNFSSTWQLLTLVLNVQTVPLFIAMFYLCESPRWLLETGRSRDAQRVLSKMAKENRATNVDTVDFNFINTQDTPADNNDKHVLPTSYRGLFHSRMLTQFTLTLMFTGFVTGAENFGLTFNVDFLQGSIFTNVAVLGKNQRKDFKFIIETLSHWECGHFCHAIFANFEMISTTTGSWTTTGNPTVRGRRNHLEVCKSCMAKVTWVSTHSMGQSIHCNTFSAGAIKLIAPVGIFLSDRLVGGLRRKLTHQLALNTVLLANLALVVLHQVYLVPSRVWTPSVTFVMQLLQISRWFRRRRAVGFNRADRAFGAIESNCPSSSKSSGSLQKLHDKGDEGVHTRKSI